MFNWTDGSSLEPSPSVIHLVEGRPATLSCTAVGGYPRPRLQLLVDDRAEPATPGTAMSTASAAALRRDSGERGLRTVALASWRWTVNYRARPGDDGAPLKCLASVPGLTAVVSSVQLKVDCKGACTHSEHICLPHAVVTNSIRLRFSRRSTLIRLHFDCVTTSRRPTIARLCVCGLLHSGLNK